MRMIISFEVNIKRKNNRHTQINVGKAAITQTEHGESDHLCSVGKRTHGSFTYVRSATLNTVNHILMTTWVRHHGLELG